MVSQRMRRALAGRRKEGRKNEYAEQEAVAVGGGRSEGWRESAGELSNDDDGNLEGLREENEMRVGGLS